MAEDQGPGHMNNCVFGFSDIARRVSFRAAQGIIQASPVAMQTRSSLLCSCPRLDANHATPQCLASPATSWFPCAGLCWKAREYKVSL